MDNMNRSKDWNMNRNMDDMNRLNHMDRSRSWGRMDGRMDNMNRSKDWNMNRNMDDMNRLNHMDRIDRMDMNWMNGRNERRFRSRSNSVHRTQSANFDCC